MRYYYIGHSDGPCLSSKPHLYELDLIKGNGKTVKTLSRSAGYWEQIATRLYFEAEDIMSIGRDHHLQTMDACRKMFMLWLEGKGRSPQTWETIIRVLEEAELLEMASDLKVILGV